MLGKVVSYVKNIIIDKGWKKIILVIVIVNVCIILIE